MIDLLKKTIEQEIEILGEVSVFLNKVDGAGASERIMLNDSVSLLLARMKKNNSEFGDMLNKIQIQKSETKIETFEKMPQIKSIETKKINVVSGKSMPKIEKKDREKYLEELAITEKVLKKIRAKKEIEKVEEVGFKKARGYLKLANKYFLERATKMAKEGYFKELPSALKKSNLDMLFESYIAMMLFTVFLSIFVGILLSAVLFFSGIANILIVIFIPLIVPLIVFIALYYYPGAEGNAISSRVNQELPFAVIHMNSISGSGITPLEIFKIIALSKEYPYLRKEIRKVLNQVNVYGYDLVSALNNVSKGTSNQNLAELFAGISTTISSGGSLSSFFEKRAESLLNNYRLEKEKAIKIAETSMDIYISIVIAAPMILMLMLVMISVSGIQIGFTPYQLTFLTIGGVALINVAFLGYLQTKRGLY